MGEHYLIRRLLNLPDVYRKFERIIARKNGRQDFCDRYIGRVQGKRILDLGCGTGDILDCISGEAEYVGIDNNSRYIDQDKVRFGERKTASFYCTDLNVYAKESKRKFDMILMTGVIHHISDKEVEMVMDNIKTLLDCKGVFISLDACYVKKMNPIAKLLCRLDRGQYVRYKEQYLDIMNKHWSNVWYEIRTDTLRFLPYSVIVFKNTDFGEEL